MPGAHRHAGARRSSSNRVSPALFSPAALNLARRLPTTTDPCGQLTHQTSNSSDQHQAVGRIDYQQTTNHLIFGRYMMTSYDEPSPFSLNPDNVLSTATPGLDNLAQSVAGGSTLVFGNNMVNSLRFAFNRTSIHRGSPPWFEPKDLGSKVYSYNPGEMVLTITGGFNIAAGTAHHRAVQHQHVPDRR